MSAPAERVWRVPAAKLWNLGVQLLQRSGSNSAEAETVARNLVLSNLKGCDSHGIGYLPRYVHVALQGGLKVNGGLEVLNADAPHSAIIRCDGGMSYGQVVGQEAMAVGIERCRQHGVAVVSLANSHHLGRIGAWAEQCVAAGLCSIHLTNVAGHSPLVAPHLGADARLGTNPFTVGCLPMTAPASQSSSATTAAKEDAVFSGVAPGSTSASCITSDDDFPIVLDYATSEMALGRLRECFARGEPAPPNAVLDAAGRMTADPSVMFTPQASEQGSLLPFGEHKGYALSFMCEVFGAVLTNGTNIDPNQHPREQTSGALASITNSMLTVILDPAAVSGRSRDEVQRSVEGVSRYMRDSPLRPDACSDGDRVSGGVLVPGQKEALVFAERSRLGIPLARGTYDALVGAGAKVDIDRAAVDAALGAVLSDGRA